MAKKVKINEALCKGCALCIDACPVNALSLGEEFNHEGYNFAVVNEEKCIGCGTCYTVCPDYAYTVVEN